MRACVLLMHAYACTCNLPLCPRRLSKSIMCHFTKSGFPLIAPKCTKCAVAFHRWLSRAEQPCAKLCPVQSAEVKLIEMNTFCNYAHIGNTVGTAAKQSRCGILVGASKFALSTNQTEKHYWKSFLFILTEPPYSKSFDLIALDCLSYIFCFLGVFFCHELSTPEPSKRYSYYPTSLVLSQFWIIVWNILTIIMEPYGTYHKLFPLTLELRKLQKTLMETQL